ncbi:MAG: Asp-tRNA(Asn)/Glu-tRNA(Gln) amidotransferase subunit GatC [Alphaproteobacteria bacterium]|nr:Asp-tRNA(Asn)/Glu-tRNA(Gln) amidotransferase subunit GatC [Alphaproteobacteria bacterium]
MAIDNETVKQIAYLARLGVEPEKLEETQKEFNKILSWVEELGEVDTSGVEPMISPYEDSILLREDKVTEGCQSSKILSNAPAKEFGYFAVPKVVE